MSRATALMNFVTPYRLWQAPFAEKKFVPIGRDPSLRSARSVLDVGCGPGTNSAHFPGSEYLGIDLNPAYVDYARRRFGRNFLTADARTFSPAGSAFDFVLINSLLHHVDDEGTHQILGNVARLLTPGGHVHIVDLILPERASIARTLARWDRGDHARPLEAWRRLFVRHFEPMQFEPYSVGALGATLWHLIYFKGARRTG